MGLFAAVAQVLMRRARRLYQQELAPVDLPAAAFALDASLLHLSARLFPWPVAANATPPPSSRICCWPVQQFAACGRLAPKARGQRLKSSTTCPWSRVVFMSWTAVILIFTRCAGWPNKASSWSAPDAVPVFANAQPGGANVWPALRSSHPPDQSAMHSHRSYPQTLRRVRLWDDTNQKSLVLLTNHFEVPQHSLTEANCHAGRSNCFLNGSNNTCACAIFRRLNAVQCQVWSALCVYLLRPFSRRKATSTRLRMKSSKS